jgi:hypothetical protein
MSLLRERSVRELKRVLGEIYTVELGIELPREPEREEFLSQRLSAAAQAQIRRQLGERPFFWQVLRAPPARHFHVEWTDREGRQYLDLDCDGWLAVRITRQQQQRLPVEGEELLLNAEWRVRVRLLQQDSPTTGCFQADWQ